MYECTPEEEEEEEEEDVLPKAILEHEQDFHDNNKNGRKFQRRLGFRHSPRSSVRRQS